MSPAELLAASCDDEDHRAGYLWDEYAEAFTGRRQLVWSRGLKTLAGVGEVNDEEAATDEMQEGQVETGRANIPHRIWKERIAVRSKDARTDLLDRAEEVGPDRAAQEVVSGIAHDDAVIDDGYRPPAGGLGARALESARGPP